MTLYNPILAYNPLATLQQPLSSPAGPADRRTTTPSADTLLGPHNEQSWEQMVHRIKKTK